MVPYMLGPLAVLGSRHDLSTSAFHYRKGPATKPPTPTVARHRADLVPLRAASKTKRPGPWPPLTTRGAIPGSQSVHSQ